MGSPPIEIISTTHSIKNERCTTELRPAPWKRGGGRERERGECTYAIEDRQQKERKAHQSTVKVGCCKEFVEDHYEVKNALYICAAIQCLLSILSSI